jgi:hypothetical protein
MNNLTINGMDFNAELDLLSEFMKEFICNYDTYKLNVSALPSDTDVDEVIKAYKKIGVVFYSNNKSNEKPIEIVSYSFENWKNRNNIINTARYRRTIDTEMMLYPLLPKDCFTKEKELRNHKS